MKQGITPVGVELLGEHLQFYPGETGALIRCGCASSECRDQIVVLWSDLAPLVARLREWADYHAARTSERGQQP